MSENLTSLTDQVSVSAGLRGTYGQTSREAGHADPAGKLTQGEGAVRTFVKHRWSLRVAGTSAIVAAALAAVVAIAIAANITGTNGPDVLAGTPVSDNIKGLGGGDIIFG